MVLLLHCNDVTLYYHMQDVLSLEVAIQAKNVNQMYTYLHRVKTEELPMHILCQLFAPL